MKTTLPDLALFRAVVEAKGVAAAADALGSSPPAVSRRLAALEDQLGVQLAERRSRRFRLTAEGMLLYERACSLLAQVQDLEAEVASRGNVARGVLRIGAPSEFGRRYVAPLVGEFALRHVDLHAHLILSDIGLEVGEDAFDVVLRVGLPSDEGLIARKIASTPCVVCASPAYLAKRPPPMSPTDLAEHNCLVLTRRRRVLDEWAFTGNGGDHIQKVRGSLSSGSGDVLHSWALSGFGVSMEAAWDVIDEIASGALVPLLPDYQVAGIDLFATFAPSKVISPRIRLFVDFLAERMARSIGTFSSS
jgi:DNA-binding transcriptional LysR family regulator